MMVPSLTVAIVNMIMSQPLFQPESQNLSRVEYSSLIQQANQTSAVPSTERPVPDPIQEVSILPENQTWTPDCRHENHAGQIYESYDVVQPLDEYFTLGDVASNVCEYRSDVSGSDHFPHALQQVLFCHSYWESNHVKDRVLYVPPNKKRNVFAMEYTRGLFDVLQKEWNVQINTTVDPSIPTALVNHTKKRSRYDFVVQDLSHGQSFRRGMRRYIEVEEEPQRGSSPVIGIVNRNTSRFMYNVPRLKQLLGDQFTIREAYFENKNFSEQLRFMSDVDILVSPDGAQMTSLVVLPPCARVLEVFPVGYLWKNFFGSLAATVGVDLSYIYTGRDIEYAHKAMSHYLKKVRARGQNVCPNVDLLYEGVLQHVSEWHRCMGH